jgi:hypothetical protein
VIANRSAIAVIPARMNVRWIFNFSPSAGREKMMFDKGENMEITIGSGDRIISTLTREGKIAVGLRKQTEPRPIGEFANDAGQEYYPEAHPDDVMIWLDNLESARILQDTVNLAVLNLQGIPRKSKEFPGNFEQFPPAV